MATGGRMANDLDRRDFLAGLGVTRGGAALGELAPVGDAAAQDTPKGRVPEPHYGLAMTNIRSADGGTTALAIAKAWPYGRRIAVIDPDYGFGRWFQTHFDAAREKLLPASEIVSEVWAPLGTTEFNSHITKTLAAKPDIIVTSMWGGMYVAFYKQALRHGMFGKARLAGNINFGVVPQAIGKDHPEGALAGVHSNYHFTYARSEERRVG